MASISADRSTVLGTRRSYRPLRHGVLMLGLALSGVADACTLDALLSLPLERLLELTIRVQHASQRGADLPWAASRHADGSLHAQ